MKMTHRSSVLAGLYRLSLSTYGFLLMALLVSGVILTGCVSTQDKPPREKVPFTFTDLVPLTPQPDTASVQGGLSVWYLPDFNFEHVGEMPKGDPPYSWGFAGKKPILILDRKFEPQEKVFDSGQHRGVALQMDGMIKFPTSGQYGIMALSNDGIRVYIGEKRVINDPDWHGDRFSRNNILELSESGWYPFKLKYFQRRGTAALKLFWKKPEDVDFSIIPAEAYGHVPN
jgi:hypothetical protein